MDGDHPKIGQNPARIRPLDDAAINRIAAGEVIERSASAVKELVENAIDAGATRIDIDIAAGGKSLIRVSDNGSGIASADLPLALSRHATSKIDGSDLLNIHSFGFRGEALASLAGVARLRVTSRASGGEGAAIRAEGGTLHDVRPAASAQGTVVEVRDLFFATPARLKFLRTDRAETQAVTDMVRRLAMAAPDVAFRLRDVTGAPRVLLDLGAATGLGSRLGAILGADFIDNALALDVDRDGLHLGGFAALPTYSRGAATQQFVIVNGRPVKDRMLLGALRAGYRDVLARDRHPAAVLVITCDPVLVDVNVHPAKSEVRFRDPAASRGLVVSGLRRALSEAGHRASSTVADAALGAFQAPDAPRIYQMDRPAGPAYAPAPPPRQTGFAEAMVPSARADEPATDTLATHDGPLGAARAQVHENYVIAQTPDGIVIVDQHAAHERLVYERLKTQMAENGIARQLLLVPEIIELGEADVARLLDNADTLTALGLVIEPFGSGAVAVQETPALLGSVNASALVRDILDGIADMGGSEALETRLDAILSRVACHGSIRSGRQMRAEEMNALLRDMEATPLSGQCNHGRPTYVELKLADIERLFGRR
ncbi:MAG: DNA mismatch repair endonuclease MutL [Pseudomonadota bacterium]